MGRKANPVLGSKKKNNTDTKTTDSNEIKSIVEDQDKIEKAKQLLASAESNDNKSVIEQNVEPIKESEPIVVETVQEVDESNNHQPKTKEHEEISTVKAEKANGTYEIVVSSEMDVAIAYALAYAEKYTDKNRPAFIIPEDIHDFTLEKYSIFNYEIIPFTGIENAIRQGVIYVIDKKTATKKDMLKYILPKINDCALYVCSYSMTEEESNMIIQKSISKDGVDVSYMLTSIFDISVNQYKRADFYRFHYDSMFSPDSERYITKIVRISGGEALLGFCVPQMIANERYLNTEIDEYQGEVVNTIIKSTPVLFERATANTLNCTFDEFYKNLIRFSSKNDDLFGGEMTSEVAAMTSVSLLPRNIIPSDLLKMYDEAMENIDPKEVEKQMRDNGASEDAIIKAVESITGEKYERENSDVNVDESASANEDENEDAFVNNYEADDEKEQFENEYDNIQPEKPLIVEQSKKPENHIYKIGEIVSVDGYDTEVDGGDIQVTPTANNCEIVAISHIGNCAVVTHDKGMMLNVFAEEIEAACIVDKEFKRQVDMLNPNKLYYYGSLNDDINKL